MGSNGPTAQGQHPPDQEGRTSMNTPPLDLYEERKKLIKDTLLEILESPEGYEIMARIIEAKEN